MKREKMINFRYIKNVQYTGVSFWKNTSFWKNMCHFGKNNQSNKGM